MQTMHVRFMQMTERVALKWLLLRVILLFAKALLCAVSVVKGDRVQRWSHYKLCTKRDKSVSVVINECTYMANRSVIFWFE